MRVLDLFSGVGGFSLGLEGAGMETVAFCEFDDHAQQILKKHWPKTKIYKDVRELNAKKYRGSVDVVTGGFPCQDLSSAGVQKGFDGERSSLYIEMLRIISECLPRYAIFENVSGLLTGGGGKWFAKFLYDLAAIGYSAQWHSIEASHIGGTHHRDRVWVIAYPNGELLERRAEISNEIQRQIQRFNSIFPRNLGMSDTNESPLLRVDDGISGRLDRVEARKRIARLGNTVVPQIPEIIGRALMKYEESQ